MTRREQILATAAELFAARGFHGVSVSEIGAACGISGPALYKHFPAKDAVLAAMLVGISEELLTEGRRRAEANPEPDDALLALIAWHVDFAINHRALIVVQDRDWESLPAEARETVRALQREYVDLWAGQLLALDPDLTLQRARAITHANFGLLNSTPHSSVVPAEEMRTILEEMSLRSLGRTTATTHTNAAARYAAPKAIRPAGGR
ncbi:TetR/AcrR family transcriptional regulator [Nocardioides alcanivorans]|uniref:TetR/AcrR family transcriptional regulator n=1 Tax=Nocardioides alcanivorans TaxID=2897352 RepID=UPI001F34B004|nr:TetR/AcrR family transcriptional regulator [Nocardioides alcanivorans]